MALKLREIREGLGLKQQDIAKMTGFTRSSISSWERGATLPTSEAVARLSRVLDVTPNDLLGWWDDHDPGDFDDFTVSEDERELLRNYRASSKVLKRHLMVDSRLTSGADEALFS